MPHENRRAAWLVQDLDADRSWICTLDGKARTDLTAAVRKACTPDRPLLDYRRADFDLGAAGPTIAAALQQVRDGTGFAILRGMPRAELTATEFELLTWAIGLHTGVARPQGKASQYLSAVRDAGTTYRSGKGRGYSSNADLDFHTDSADIVLLTCYNVARSGGQSLVSSSVTAHDILAKERPDLAELLHQPYYFSRQQEQAPDEPACYPNPVYDEKDGLLFSKWNRNRLNSAQAIEGVPQLTAMQKEALERLDEILRRPDVCYSMYLQPGDMQILNNHVTLHSRTEFEDHDDPALKRCLFRLWLAPPDSVALPESWRPAYRSVAAGSVRGGIVGQAYDATRQAYERRQAADLGMAA
ncbi:MAG TPA: TauD/TfdA family dioxygenase [Rhodopila sp.]|uniref:TauD/TfdA family dioxygenase n=1 Tax=Rhodopila sp. TaxID=2480087 RepID=UPI002C2AD31A|nr:TauD/TfdA family dioxygenase [Rhodopila sp.]HVY17559.1 TauD/TfdA family dioxygenase [Rhodopila sp.]